MPEVRNGYLFVNDRPGLGLNLNEPLLAKHPAKHEITTWTQTRYVDGTMCTP